MIQARTSKTHPLQIAQVCAGSGYGNIGITFCPGKCDPFAATGTWQRDLKLDLKVISNWAPSLILTLMESTELKMLKVENLGEAIQEKGINWLHLPIADFSIPSQQFEDLWLGHGTELRKRLRLGEHILIHCKGGLGRAGMIAARLLVELGWEPQAAIKKVREVRKGAIETPSQLNLVLNTKKQESE